MAIPSRFPRSAPFLLLALLLLLGTGCGRILRWAQQVPSLTPRQLAAELARPVPPLVLDVRDAEDYQKGHIPGARSLPPEGVEGFLSRAALPADQRVVVVCYGGHLSKLAAGAAAPWHRGEVADLEGGMEAWTGQDGALAAGTGEPVPEELHRPPLKRLGTVAQAVAFTLASVVKPFYMLVCLGLALVLLKARSTPLRLLFWGLVSFDLGEAFCALDYFLADRSGMWAPLDLLHGAGMVGMGVLGTWGLMRLADEHVLGYGEPAHACVIQRFCGSCWKRNAEHCGLHRLFVWTLPALALLSLIPLSVPMRPMHYQAQVFSTTVVYGAPLGNELVELQGYAVLGALCFLGTLLALRGGGPASTRRAELPFFLGVGFSSFAIFRFFLHQSFRSAVHASDFWEEITETVAMLGIALVLWTFRKQLGLFSWTRRNSGDGEGRTPGTSEEPAG